MKQYKKFAGVIVVLLAFVTALAIVFSPSTPDVKTALGSGNIITNYAHVATSSAILVTTSSTLVMPTSTDRTYLRISNIAGKPIFCTLSVRGTNSSTYTTGPAIMYQGITIFASSTLEFKIDENPYTGPVYCISEANSSTTISQY